MESLESSPVSVFIAYSHEDDVFREELEQHIAILRRLGLVGVWNDRRIPPGDEWEAAISSHLETANLVLLLVSSSFLASDYCYGIEMNRALERHEMNDAVVVPIVIRSCHWMKGSLGKLQALPVDATPVASWPIRDEAWTDVVRGLEGVVNQLSAVKGDLGMQLKAEAPKDGAAEGAWGLPESSASILREVIASAGVSAEATGSSTDQEHPAATVAGLRTLQDISPGRAEAIRQELIRIGADAVITRIVDSMDGASIDQRDRAEINRQFQDRTTLLDEFELDALIGAGYMSTDFELTLPGLRKLVRIGIGRDFGVPG